MEPISLSTAIMNSFQGPPRGGWFHAGKEGGQGPLSGGESEVSKFACPFMRVLTGLLKMVGCMSRAWSSW
ncbi:unnamed protein product [Toxocara canis]|uniref:Alternative protein n=1 Tax=Toxocara canis TaxID=6265 RepID=A0A183V4T2_TOXCA|nr:unnamed protein product [Toxocara canis]